MRPMTYTTAHGRLDISCVRRDLTTIAAGEGAFDALRQYLSRMADAADTPAVVVADGRAWELHGERMEKELSRTRVPYAVVHVESGERSKSLDALTRVWRELADAGARRRTTLLSFGGGVVCDMVGFAAATFMRGLPYVNIPTTLLAQVDAAIGGKVAVDTPWAKNVLGAFYHPRLVIVWPGFLTTLSQPELAAGMAEVVKVATLTSERLFEQVEALGVVSPSTAGAISEDQLLNWIRAKLDLLGPDPYETGSLDRALNYGHSFGHAIETTTKYEVYRHGEAVAIGMAIACRIAVARGVLNEGIAHRILGCLRRNGLPTTVPENLVGDVWETLEAVRKVRDGALREVLPTGLGSFQIVGEVARSEYLTAATSMCAEAPVAGD